MNENLKRLINASKSCRSAGWIALAAGAVLLLSSDAQAQLSGARWRSGGGWGVASPIAATSTQTPSQQFPAKSLRWAGSNP